MIIRTNASSGKNETSSQLQALTEDYTCARKASKISNSLMADSSRISRIHGSINSTFYIDPEKPLENTIIRVEGSKLKQSDFINQQVSLDNFNQQIVISSYTAWILLLISSLCSSFVTPWLLVDVKAEGFTRNGWRMLVTSAYLLPFLFYERRHLEEKSQTFLKQITRKNLKPIFISTINFNVWLLCLIYACRHTSMNHSVFLCCLRFFSLTVVRMYKGEKIHQFQIAGAIMCTLGTLLMLGDSLTVPQSFQPGVSNYQKVVPWKRVIFGDFLAIFASYVAVFLDQNHQVPEMPKFTYMFVYNIFLCINSIAFGYFFGGSDFSFNPKQGVFGLFTYENFVGILYVSILLGIWMIIINILIAQIFTTVIIDIASNFELIICCFIWNLFGLEKFPFGMTCLGYAFLMPGLVFIIGGRGILDNIDNNINFQLYRPTQVNMNQSFRTLLRPTLKESWEILKDSVNTPVSGQKDLVKSIKFGDKKPFDMIMEEDEQENKQNRYRG